MVFESSESSLGSAEAMEGGDLLSSGFCPSTLLRQSAWGCVEEAWHPGRAYDEGLLQRGRSDKCELSIASYSSSRSLISQQGLASVLNNELYVSLYTFRKPLPCDRTSVVLVWLQGFLVIGFN